MTHTVKFRQRFYDEDDSDESGETFFGESGEVPNERGEVEGDDDEAEEAGPKANVQPEVHVIKLKWKKSLFLFRLKTTRIATLFLK